MSLSASLPIPWLSSLVPHCQYRRDASVEHVMHGVGEVAQDVVPHFVFVGRPHVRGFPEPINGVKRFTAESIRSKRASLEIPKERFANFCLRWRQNLNHKSRHSALSRARASAQGTGLRVPSRSACLRCRSSSRQASEIAASVLPSRLSSSATTRAERSSTGRFKASVSSWSTRAFIRFSLLLAVRACQQVSRAASNPSFHTDALRLASPASARG